MSNLSSIRTPRRLLWQRWWIPVYFVLAFTVLTLLRPLAPSEDGEGLTAAEANVDLHSLAALAAVGFVIMTMIAFAIYSRHDGRLVGIRRAHPRAVVAQVVVDETVAASIRNAISGAPDINADSDIGRKITLLVNGDGLTFWKGENPAVVLFSVPWAHIASFTVGDVVKGRVKHSATLDINLYSDDEPVSIVLAIERSTFYPTYTHRLTHRMVAQLILRLNAQRVAVASVEDADGLTSGSASFSDS